MIANRKTNEAKRLFTDRKGSFSPDGKYFACPAYILSYEEDAQTAINVVFKNYVCGWVKKDKVEELKELIK